MPESLFDIEVLPGVRGFDPSEWAVLSGASKSQSSYNPFVSHAFLSALELSGCVGPKTGWQPQFLKVTRPGGEVLGAVPAYMKSHSQGEYVFDHGWADAFERAGGRYYPKLQISVPFTPATGPRLLTSSETDEDRAALAQAIQSVTRSSKLSSAHATFLTEADVQVFKRDEWLIRTDQQFHFINRAYRDYQDFLDTLASRKRKNLRKERETALSGGISIEWLTGADLTETVWDAFFAFYMDTGSRKWGRPYLTRQFFSLIGETMADDVLLVMAKRNGRFIAGAINFLGSDRIFGRNWGCLEDHPFLHFEVCYHQAIEFAIGRKLSVVEAGAQGEHKLSRGYEPVTTRSAHFIAHEGLRRAVSDYLVHERAEIERVNALLGEHTPFRKGERLTAAGEQEQ